MQIPPPVHTLQFSQKTDGTFSSHPIIFQSTLNVPLQIFLFHRRIVRKNPRLFHGSCHFNLVRRNPWRLYVTLRWRTYCEDHVRALESSKSFPTHYSFPRRLHKILGLFGWHSSSNYPTPSANIHDHSSRQSQGLCLCSHIKGHQAPDRRWYTSLNFKYSSPNIFSP